MELETLFFVTQSIFGIAATLFFVVVIILIVYLFKALKNIMLRAENALNESYDAAVEAKNYTSKVGRVILDYLIIKIFKNIRRQ